MGFFRRRDSYAPWYEDHADYNTNAKAYYDYLAKKNWDQELFKELINTLLKRNINVEDTNSIDFSKNGDWFDSGDGDYQDIIDLSADIKLSNENQTVNLIHTENKVFTLQNALETLQTGVFSPDYLPLIKELDEAFGKIPPELVDVGEELTTIKNDITNMKNTLAEHTTSINNLTGAVQKLLDNLHDSGALSTNNLTSYSFLNDRDIATGNINLYGGKPDGSTFIKTSNQKNANDITAGY